MDEYDDEENNGWWNPKLVGAVIGLILGLTLIFAGALNALILIGLVGAGWIVGKYFAGEIDMDDLYDRYLRGRTRGTD